MVDKYLCPILQLFVPKFVFELHLYNNRMKEVNTKGKGTASSKRANAPLGGMAEGRSAKRVHTSTPSREPNLPGRKFVALPADVAPL